MQKPGLAFLAILLLVACRSNNSEQAIRERELVLKTKELNLQKKALELQEQELKQAQLNQEQMQALLKTTQSSTVPGFSAGTPPGFSASPSLDLTNQPVSTGPTPSEQLELQKQVLEMHQKLLKQLEGSASIPTGAPMNDPSAIQPYAPVNDPQSATRQNAQSPEMQKLLNDVRRRSGQ